MLRLTAASLVNLLVSDKEILTWQLLGSHTDRLTWKLSVLAPLVTSSAGGPATTDEAIVVQNVL